MTLSVHTIRAFSDNYLWLFHQAGSTEAYVVDPGDAAPVEKTLASEGLNLAGILVTHQHPDHIGGIPKLLADHDVPVYGPADIGVVSNPVTEGDSLQLAGVTIRVLSVPGHTLNHLAYVVEEEDHSPKLFCGDTLFAGGCGRLFEGTAEQMHHSLQKLAQLSPRTLIYCAHEYTLSNLKFALAVEPDNIALQHRLTEVCAKRDGDIPTVPTSLDVERQTNPFLRCDIPDVIASAKAQSCESESPVAVFATLRRWKDNF